MSEARSGTAAVGQESRKLLVVGGLVVAALLALALWADRHRWEEPGVPVTAPTAPTPTPTIDPYAGDFEELTEELRWRVLAAAGVDQPTEVDCETDGIPDRSGTYGCTVTYDGVEVPFKVHFDVSEDLYGRRRSVFEIVQKKTVLTKEGVFAAFWRYGKERGYTEPRCDDIPATTVVEVGDTPYRCYYKWDNSIHHRSVKVRADEHGLDFSHP